MMINQNRHKIFTFTVILLMMLAVSACSTSRKSSRKKNCDCPHWSMFEIPKEPTHEKV